MAAAEPAPGTLLAAVKAAMDRAPGLGLKKLIGVIKSEHGFAQRRASDVRQAKAMLTRDPTLLTDMEPDALLCILQSKDSLTSRDLACLACAAKTFTPALIDEAAEALVGRHSRPERCPRREAFQEDHRADGTPGEKRDGERWPSILRQLEQLSRPLAFTFTAGKKDAGEGREAGPAAAYGSMVCSDFPMRAGIHAASFTVNEHTSWGAIGIVRSQLMTTSHDGGSAVRSAGFHGPVGDPAEYLAYRASLSDYDRKIQQYEPPAPGEDSPELLSVDTTEIVWMCLGEDGWGWSSDNAQGRGAEYSGGLLHGSMCSDGNTRHSASEWPGQQSWASGDVLGLRFDVDCGQLTAYKNGERLGQMHERGDIQLEGEWGSSEAFYFCADIGETDSYESVSIAWAEPTDAEEEAAAFDAQELDRHEEGLCGPQVDDRGWSIGWFSCKHCDKEAEDRRAARVAEKAAGP